MNLEDVFVLVDGTKKTRKEISEMAQLPVGFIRLQEEVYGPEEILKFMKNLRHLSEHRE